MQLIKELILHSDVLIENFRAGVMEKMGLGYEELHKLNSRLIMVSITGFGHSGPLRDRMAFDGIISAMSGVTRIDGDKVERSKGAIHDHMAGMNAVIGTLLALLDREKKRGKGQYVDTAMIACSTVLRSDSIADAYLNGDEAAMGSDDAAPYGYLKTKGRLGQLPGRHRPAVPQAAHDLSGVGCSGGKRWLRRSAVSRDASRGAFCSDSEVGFKYDGRRAGEKVC